MIESLMSDKQVVENSAGWLLALCERMRTSQRMDSQQSTERDLEFRWVMERLTQLEELLRDWKGLREAEKKMQRWEERWNTVEGSVIVED